VAEAVPAGPPQSYGGQILASDLISAGVWGLALGLEKESLVYAGWGAYALGPVVIHAAHGRGDLVVEHGLLRAAAPPAGLFLAAVVLLSRPCDTGWFSDNTAPEWCGPLAITGLVAPILAASIFDIATAETPAPAKARRPRPESLAWAPTVAPSSNGATVGFAGRF
jgi:hypothetical protein